MPFLAFLAAEMERRPQSVMPLTPDFVAGVDGLVAGVEYDPGEPIDDDLMARSRKSARQGAPRETTPEVGTPLARALLSTALDEAVPEPSTIVDLLDSIPGAFERANQGLREIRSGEGRPLDEF